MSAGGPSSKRHSIDAAEIFGSPPTILVNNAGIDAPPATGGKAHRLEEIPLAVNLRILEVNTAGLFLVTQVFGGAMAKAHRGSIINIGSLYASVSPDARFYDHILTVAAHQVLGPTGVDVSFTATMQLRSRALAHFDCSVNLPDRSHLEVVGSEGTLHVSDPWHCLKPGLTVIPQGKPALRVPVPQANSYQLELEEFGRAVRGVTHHLLGCDDALQQARAVDALFKAAASGKRETVR